MHVWHDKWLALDENQQEIPGRKLQVWEQHVELTDDYAWDSKGRWRSLTKLAFVYTDDNGGGVYDYYRYGIGEDLRYQATSWELKIGGRISYDDFPVQQADLTQPGGPKLRRTLLEATARVERKLSKALRCFAQYTYERTLSNSAMDEYAANTVTGGVSWEF
jgi:hypothetical protein